MTAIETALAALKINSNVAAFQTEIRASVVGLEDWMIETDDSDVVTQVAISNLATELHAACSRLFTLYCDGFTVDRAANDHSLSAIRNVREWLANPVAA